MATFEHYCPFLLSLSNPFTNLVRNFLYHEYDTALGRTIPVFGP